MWMRCASEAGRQAGKEVDRHSGVLYQQAGWVCSLLISIAACFLHLALDCCSFVNARMRLGPNAAAGRCASNGMVWHLTTLCQHTFCPGRAGRTCESPGICTLPLS